MCSAVPEVVSLEEKRKGDTSSHSKIISAGYLLCAGAISSVAKGLTLASGNPGLGGADLSPRRHLGRGGTQESTCL